MEKSLTHSSKFFTELNVIPVLITLGNTYGLLLVTVLLGYGLVAFPRSLWRRSHTVHELNKIYLVAVELDDALYDAVWSLQDIEYEIDIAVSRIVDLDENESGDIHYRYCVNELLHRKTKTADLAPELHMRRTNNHGNGTGRDGEDHDRYNEDRAITSDGRPTMKELVELNRKLIRAQENLFNAEQRWNALRENYHFFSSIEEGNTANGVNTNASSNLEMSFSTNRHANDDAHSNVNDGRDDLTSSRTINQTTVTMPAAAPPSPLSGKSNVNANQSLLRVSDAMGKCAALKSKLDYLWKKYLRGIFFRIGAILAWILSSVILWSEATLASKYNLSPFSRVQEYLSTEDEHIKRDGLFFQIAVLIPLLYMAICVSTGLFSVGRFGPYSLRGHRQSTGTALVFNTQYLVRLQFSLGYNYLMMLKYDTSDCAFSQFVGQMDIVPLFGKSFPVYAPLLILFLCAFTLFNVYAKLMNFLGFDHSDALLVGDQEALDSKINEGRNLLRQYDQDVNEGDRNAGAFSFASGGETELTETKSWSRSIV